MNFHQLETFMIVCAEGSFSKAAEKLYISPTAIIKQMTVLEKEVGVRLFLRSSKGISLTRSGSVFEKDVARLLEQKEKAVCRARQFDQKETVIRIATSITTPARYFLDLVPDLQRQNKNLHLKFVSFENTPKDASYIFDHFGKEIDVVAGFYSEQLLKTRKCSVQKIADLPMRVILSVHHPLAKKERLSIEDLEGQNLFILREGLHENFDRLRHDLEKKHPLIHLHDFDFYNLEIFNECEASHSLMIGFDYWQFAHPLIRILPVDWSYTNPYGLMFSRNPDDRVLELVETLRTLV